MSVQPTNNLEDDTISDLAMKALKDSANGKYLDDDDEGDGSWLLQLLKFHVDPKIRYIFLFF
jgi:hypothetical protein